MDNRYETDEEKEARIRKEIMEELKNKEKVEELEKDKMRKEILDELNNNSNKNNPMANSNIQSFGPPKKVSKVSFSKNITTNNSNNNEISKSNDDNSSLSDNNSNNNGKVNIVVVLFCIIITIGVIAFLPKINKMISKDKKVKPVSTESNVSNKTSDIEKLTLTSDKVKNIKYPVLHINSANKNTYLKKNSISVSNLSNNDILYNAFIDVYDGNMKYYKGSYDGKYCGKGNQKVSLDYRYLELRVEGSFSRNTKYSHKDLVIPANNPKTNYIGVWKYNKKGKYYLYYGNCNQKSSNVLYLDINVPYDVNNKRVNEKYKIDELYLDNYIGFAEVNVLNKQYVIYSDADYTKKVTSGTLTTNNYEKELKEVVNKIGKDSLNKYQYTYSTANCPYNEYCFKSGQWVK